MWQHQLWNSHAVRDARQAAAEAYLGRRMELDDLPPRDVAALVANPQLKTKPTKSRGARRIGSS